jgi:hypothetical protein
MSEGDELETAKEEGGGASRTSISEYVLFALVGVVVIGGPAACIAINVRDCAAAHQRHVELVAETTELARQQEQMNKRVSATWNGVVAHTEGIYIAPETRCVLDAKLRGGDGARLWAGLRLTCGGLTLYELGMDPGETRPSPEDVACSMSERTGDNGLATALRCFELGCAASEDRASRPKIDFDTKTNKLMLYGNQAPMIVEIKIDAWSATRSGPALTAN